MSQIFEQVRVDSWPHRNPFILSCRPKWRHLSLFSVPQRLNTSTSSVSFSAFQRFSFPPQPLNYSTAQLLLPANTNHFSLITAFPSPFTRSSSEKEQFSSPALVSSPPGRLGRNCH